MAKVEPSLSQMHYIVLPLVRRAGQMLVSRQKGLVSATPKERRERVEAIQREIREFMVTTLVRLFPSHTVRDFDYQPAEPSELNYHWLVNELDGGRYYACGLPLFTTSLALCRGKEVVLGIVYEPANDFAYHARRGEGALANDIPIKTSEQKDAPEAAIYLESPVRGQGHDPNQRFKIWQAFVEAGCRVFDIGLPSLGLCYVAAGAFDVLIGGPEHPSFPADYAAALLIAAEAGAIVSDQSGKSLPSERPAAIIVAAAPGLHKRALSLLN